MIGIKSLNTKQYPARLSAPHVKLSSFAGGKFSPKKGESMIVAYLCVCKSKEHTRVKSFNLYLIFENEF